MSFRPLTPVRLASAAVHVLSMALGYRDEIVHALRRARLQHNMAALLARLPHDTMALRAFHVTFINTGALPQHQIRVLLVVKIDRFVELRVHLQRRLACALLEMTPARSRHRTCQRMRTGRNHIHIGEAAMLG